MKNPITGLAILLSILATACASAPASHSPEAAEARCRSYALGNNTDVIPPRLIRGNQPAPPANATSAYVCVRASITESGTVVDPVVVQTDNRSFADAFLRALPDWRYEPATRGSAKVFFHTTLFARFPGR